MLRPWGTATAFKPARAGIKRIGRLAAVMGKRLLKSDYKPLTDNVNTKCLVCRLTAASPFADLTSANGLFTLIHLALVSFAKEQTAW